MKVTKPSLQFFQVRNLWVSKYQKQVHFTVIQRFEQGLSDTLTLEDVALDRFCEDFPLADEVYIKSDNAGSYHRNCCFEVLYNIDIADLRK